MSNELNYDEILNLFEKSDTIMMSSYVQEMITMAKRKELLKKHPYNIWLGKDGFWHTYLPKPDGGRKAVKKKNEKDIQNAVINYLEGKSEETFKKRFDVWVNRQKICGRSDNTIYKYLNDYNRFFKDDEFEKLKINDITEEDIGLFFKRVLEKKEIPYRALKAVFGYMNNVFKKSIFDRVTDRNPCQYIDLLMFKQYCHEKPPKSAAERTISEAEKKALLRKIRESKNTAKYAAEFSLYTGMRVGELSSLRWSDIDFVNKTITIQTSEKYNSMTKEYIISSTKNNKIRVIPLTENMEDVLKRTKTHEIENGWLSEFVFCDGNGNIHARRIVDWMRNNTMSSEFASTKGIHDARRSLNSNMKHNGVPTTIAAAILGHTEKVNERNYTYDMSTIEEKKKIIELAGKIS